jgi:hypothetical protein
VAALYKESDTATVAAADTVDAATAATQTMISAGGKREWSFGRGYIPGLEATATPVFSKGMNSTPLPATVSLLQETFKIDLADHSDEKTRLSIGRPPVHSLSGRMRQGDVNMGLVLSLEKSRDGLAAFHLAASVSQSSLHWRLIRSISPASHNICKPPSTTGRCHEDMLTAALDT